MTYEYFRDAGLEDGLPLSGLNILWEGRPPIVDLIPENDDTRKDLKNTNAEMKDEILEMVQKLGLDEVASA